MAGFKSRAQCVSRCSLSNPFQVGRLLITYIRIRRMLNFDVAEIIANWAAIQTGESDSFLLFNFENSVFSLHLVYVSADVEILCNSLMCTFCKFVSFFFSSLSALFLMRFIAWIRKS